MHKDWLPVAFGAIPADRRIASFGVGAERGIEAPRERSLSRTSHSHTIDAPIFARERASYPVIAGHISDELLRPELGSGRRNARLWASGMTVPVAAVDEDHRAP